MLKLSPVLLVALASLPSVAQTGNQSGTQTGKQTGEPRIVTRSGSTITCRHANGCVEEEIDGRRFHVLKTSQFIVRVAENDDRKYTRFSVTVENRTLHPVHLDPADFRIEVTEPRYKRLGYIEPSKVKLPSLKPDKTVKAAHTVQTVQTAQTIQTVQTDPQPAPAASSSLPSLPAALAAPGTPQADSIHPATSGQPRAIPAKPDFLSPATLSPAASTSGQVFFERSASATNLSLLLPISGAVFEFPYSPAHP